MEGTTQYVFQESSVLPANVLLTAINSASVNGHLHCYIINLITVIVVCLLLRNSVFKIISKCVCIYIEESRITTGGIRSALNSIATSLVKY